MTEPTTNEEGKLAPFDAEEAREEADVWERRVGNAARIACQADHGWDDKLPATLRAYSTLTEKVARMEEGLAVTEGCRDDGRRRIHGVLLPQGGTGD